MDVCTTAVLPLIGVIEIHVDGLSLSKSIPSEEKGKWRVIFQIIILKIQSCLTFLSEECLDNTSNTKQFRYPQVITGPNGALSLHSCITPYKIKYMLGSYIITTL